MIHLNAYLQFILYSWSHSVLSVQIQWILYMVKCECVQNVWNIKIFHGDLE